MGGRGAASGVSNSGRRYGTEYRTIVELDSIKVARRNSDPPVLPQETMSSARGRVYAVGNRSGGLKAIGLYARDGRLRRQIDVDHTHSGQSPHIHEGYGHSQRHVRMTKSDWAYYRKVMRLWESM
jgi:hypothetical protein